jgi:hypothetical protein
MSLGGKMLERRRGKGGKCYKKKELCGKFMRKWKVMSKI